MTGIYRIREFGIQIKMVPTPRYLCPVGAQVVSNLYVIYQDFQKSLVDLDLGDNHVLCTGLSLENAELD